MSLIALTLAAFFTIGKLFFLATNLYHLSLCFGYLLQEGELKFNVDRQPARGNPSLIGIGIGVLQNNLGVVIAIFSKKSM